MSVDKGIFRRRQRQLEAFDYHSGVQEPVPWNSDELIDRYVPTHCCYCGVQCGMYLKVAHGKVVGVEPRADFPLNHGMLCPKGATAYQTVNHPDRLTYPLMRRNGKESPLERASWDEVLDTIVTRLRAIQGEHGKDAVAIYSGSSMTNEKCYLMASSRAWPWGRATPTITGGCACPRQLAPTSVHLAWTAPPIPSAICCTPIAFL